MQCYHPLSAWRQKDVVTGKSKIIFTRTRNWGGEPLQVPCGRCIGCRLARSREWAIRCVHEASLYSSNRFVTLTYSDDNLPSDCSLSVRELQLFLKKLRKIKTGFRYFACGEYGERCKTCDCSRVDCSMLGCGKFVPGLGRPHFHICLFNIAFADEFYWSRSNGVPLFRSLILEKIWGKGHCLIGDVSFESAAYVARYCLKKINGERSGEHYEGKTPEFVTMSRGGRGKGLGGIGRPWLEKFSSDVYPSDSVVFAGKEMKAPKYYDRYLELTNPEMFSKIKEDRRKVALINEVDNRPARLVVKEFVKLDSIKKFVRHSTEEI